MGFKIWFKKTIKKLNSRRKEKYIDILHKRYLNKCHRYSSYVNERLKTYPTYLFDYFSYRYINMLGRKYYRDINILKNNISEIDGLYNLTIKQMDDIDFLVNVNYPNVRKELDFNKIKFVKIHNVLNDKYIGFISYFSERGLPDTYDINVHGKFFDMHGNEVKIENFDKTYLVSPMVAEKDFKQFINLYNRSIDKLSLNEQMSEINMLYNEWGNQLTYLKLKE